MTTTSITFVTSFFHIYTDFDNIQRRIDHFREVAKTGIKLCLYVCPIMEHKIAPILREFPANIKLMQVLRLEDTFISQTLQQFPEYGLPSSRNENKDTTEFLTMIQCKVEFMVHTIQQNPWNSTHFAWIDFNISHVFSRKPATFAFLQWIHETPPKENCGIIIPGCWDQFPVDEITEKIYWRFCGGFFLGDRVSILRFHELYREYFPQFLRTYQTLVWEVNFWAWLEATEECNWTPKWYKADHNDTILTNIWHEVFTHSLQSLGVETQTYAYPNINPLYCPSSASYLNIGDKHYLNTRYVNYRFLENGQFHFVEKRNVIRNQNFFSELSGDTMDPLFFIQMDESTVDLQRYYWYSRGIEDIRLYYFQDKIRFIGTTVDYYPSGGTRMIAGDYCIGTTGYNYENSRIIESPENNWLEKNWIPMILDNPKSEFHQRELFIYKWSPFSIGERHRTNTGEVDFLDIIQEYDTSHIPFFHKMKGSTIFMDTGEYLVGVTHFTEDTAPRHYFHLLIVLDRTTLRPLWYSDPFYFEKVGIEFCIGFTIKNGQYLFWISRMDNDPLLIRIDIEKIPIMRSFFYNDIVLE